MSSKSLSFTESVRFSMGPLGIEVGEVSMPINIPQIIFRLLLFATGIYKHGASLLTTNSQLGSNQVVLEARQLGF